MAQASTIKNETTIVHNYQLFDSFDSIFIDFDHPAITNTVDGVYLTIRRDACFVITRRGERHRDNESKKGWWERRTFVSGKRVTALFVEMVDLIDRLFVSRTDSICIKTEEWMEVKIIIVKFSPLEDFYKVNKNGPI